MLHHDRKLYLKCLYPSNEVCKPSAVIEPFFLTRFLEFVHDMYPIWMKVQNLRSLMYTFIG
jgi:hypothetical protein